LTTIAEAIGDAAWRVSGVLGAGVLAGAGAAGANWTGCGCCGAAAETSCSSESRATAG
jgi:hypothetical protein